MEGGKWLKSSLTFLYQVLTKNLIINKQNSRIKTAQICFILSSFSTVCSYFESPALVFPSSWLTDEDFALVVLLQLSDHLKVHVHLLSEENVVQSRNESPSHQKAEGWTWTHLRTGLLRLGFYSIVDEDSDFCSVWSRTFWIWGSQWNKSMLSLSSYR